MGSATHVWREVQNASSNRSALHIPSRPRRTYLSNARTTGPGFRAAEHDEVSSRVMTDSMKQWAAASTDQDMHDGRFAPSPVPLRMSHLSYPVSPLWNDDRTGLQVSGSCNCTFSLENSPTESLDYKKTVGSFWFVSNVDLEKLRVIEFVSYR